MLPKHLKTYYTHLSQKTSNDSDDSNLFIVQPSSFNVEEESNFVELQFQTKINVSGQVESIVSIVNFNHDGAPDGNYPFTVNAPDELLNYYPFNVTAYITSASYDDGFIFNSSGFTRQGVSTWTGNQLLGIGKTFDGFVYQRFGGPCFLQVTIRWEFSAHTFSIKENVGLKLLYEDFKDKIIAWNPVSAWDNVSPYDEVLYSEFSVITEAAFSPTELREVKYDQSVPNPVTSNYQAGYLKTPIQQIRSFTSYLGLLNKGILNLPNRQAKVSFLENFSKNVDIDASVCSKGNPIVFTLSVPYGVSSTPRQSATASFDLSGLIGNTLPVSSFYLDDFAFVVKSTFNVAACCTIISNTRTINLPDDAFILYDGNNPNYAEGMVNDELTTNYVFMGQTYHIPGGQSMSLSIAIQGVLDLGVAAQPHNQIQLSVLLDRGYISLDGTTSFKLMHISHGAGNVTLGVNIPVCDPDVVDYTYNETAIAFIPDSKSGWLASPQFSNDMSLRTLESAAWGLLLASSYKDTEFVVSGLKAFLTLAKNNQWIILDSDNNYIINSETTYGLYPSFRLIGPQPSNNFKELAGNAFLGFVVCSVFKSLTDVKPLDEFNLTGEWGSFKDEMLLSLEALGLFCSYSISSISSFAAYKEEGGFYTYDTPSLSATTFSILFLNSLLSLQYNGYIHSQASRAQYTLLNTSLDPDSPIYTDFEEGTHQSIGLASIILWSSYYSLSNLNTLLIKYETVRGSGLSYSDCIVILACHQSEQALPSWVNLLADTDIEAQNVFMPLVVPEIPILNKSHYIHQVAISGVINQNYKLPQMYLDLCSIKAVSFVTSMLLELRRMMPFGIKWFSEEIINNVSSVIGSMLYAEADLYFSWALSLDIVEKSRFPLHAVSNHAIAWFNLTYETNVLASDGFLNNLAFLDKNKNIHDMESFINYLYDFMGITVTSVSPNPPSFSTVLPNSVEDTLLSYTVSNNSISLENQGLTDIQYLSIICKRVHGEWVERRVPGFPLIPSSLPVGAITVTIENYLENPTGNTFVIDGPIFIYPLSNCVMQSTLHLDKTSSYLTNTIKKTAPAGLMLSYTHNLELVGEE